MAIPSEQELAEMPLDQLEQLVMQQASEVSSLLGGEGTDVSPALGAPPAEAPIAPEGEQSVSPYMETGAPLDMISPDIIQMATTKLVEAGFLDVASSDMTPELIQVLQTVADSVAPGIYNLNNDADMMEFINGIANGTIVLPSTRELAGGAAEQPPAAEPAGLDPLGGLPPGGGGEPIY